MKMLNALPLFAALSLSALAPVPAAAADSFTLVNRTGAPITSIAVRRVGVQAWTAVPGSAADGARTNVNFSDPDCAFDLKVTRAGQPDLLYEGANLCAVTVVTLNRRADGSLWIDYD